MLRYLFPLILGFGGAAVLGALSLWQFERLAWKEAILAEISGKIAAQPVTLPARPDRDADRYLPVRVTGIPEARELHVLVSAKDLGAGFRVITALETTSRRRILVDHGFIPTAAKDEQRPPERATFTGNLHWPDERDRFIPDNDIAANFWHARDIEEMAAELSTEPVLLVVATTAPPDPFFTPLPVTIQGIPNNHLGYAIQWLGLAVVWLGMTGFLLWRMSRRG